MQPDPIDAIAAALRRLTGLDLGEGRRDDLHRALAKLAERYGSAAEIRERLDAGIPSELFDDLVRELTIGETMFFRHAEQFALLTSHILPALVARRRAEAMPRLTIWSAGCATGEEPYSIAIALTHALPDACAWSLTILGTDVNRDFLSAARDAAYGSWSFRGCDPRIRERFLRRGNRWVLDASVRSLVTFAPLNLVADDYPAGADVIFCRNVLIYFDAATRHRVLARLRDALAPGGWLVLGHADLGADSIDGLEPAFEVDSFVYQRMEKASPAPPEPKRPSITLPPPRPRLPVRRRAFAPEPDARSLFETAARLLDRGEDEAAADTLRRSIYLDPRQPAAHYLAGVIAERRGREQNALRHFRAAMVTLSTLADDIVIEGTEGITAGRLRQTLDARLREVTHA